MYTRTYLIIKRPGEDLGIGVGETSDRQKIIRRVKRNSPGMRAGLAKGDLIVAVDEYDCEAMSMTELFVILSQQVTKAEFAITVKTRSVETRNPLLGTVGGDVDDDTDDEQQQQQQIDKHKKCKIS